MVQNHKFILGLKIVGSQFMKKAESLEVFKADIQKWEKGIGLADF